MAYTFNVNQSWPDFASNMYYFKQQAKAAGWTVSSSGDGNLLYSSSSDIITVPTGTQPTPGSANNGLCWFVLKQPTGTRSLCIQRHNSNSA